MSGGFFFSCKNADGKFLESYSKFLIDFLAKEVVWLNPMMRQESWINGYEGREKVAGKGAVCTGLSSCAAFKCDSTCVPAFPHTWEPQRRQGLGTVLISAMR